MPKIAIDYSKTQMYKLKHKNDDDDENIYIGHTTNWIQRKSHHQGSCNCEKDRCYNDKKYKYIRENGGWKEWEMIWIEDYPCMKKNEALAREEYLRCEFKAKLNTNKAFLSKEERKNNAIIYAGVYREKYKENISIRKKERTICSCGCSVLKNTLSQHQKTQKHIKLI